MRIPSYYLDSALAVYLLAILGATFVVPDLPHANVLLIVSALLGTAPVLIGAYAALREGEWASMDLLASIALLFSLLNASWHSAVFIALMLASARILDELTKSRTEASLRGLLKLRPAEARVERAGGETEIVKLEHLKVGDVMLFDTGDRVAADGVVLSGEGSTDESMLTGESLPVEKEPNSKVFAATVVSAGSLRVRVERVGKDSTFERIVALIEQSRQERTKSETLGEKFGKAYLISVFVVSTVLLLFTHNIPLVLAVVLVVCADDVAVAIPLAYLRAIGAAAKRGIIIKGSRHLEALSSAKTILFDKTGTLTTGKLTVETAESLTSDPHEFLVALRTAAERSKHPVARTAAAYVAAQGIEPLSIESSEQIAGRGTIAYSGTERYAFARTAYLESLHVMVPDEIKAKADIWSEKGCTISYVARGTTLLGFVAVSDQIKDSAHAVIGQLKKLGYRTVMLTGDNERAAASVAERLSLDEWHANLLPEDKVAKVKELRAQGGVVMVGDGVNDAAALAIADVGIAMGALGYDAAIESAEIVLMHDQLTAIPQLVELAATTRRVSYQDFGIWGITNLAGLALVFGGLIGPAGAAAYNFLSDFLPLFNSLRVKMNRLI